jgi:hypothetical protein
MTVEVKYEELDHRSLNGLHAHSCTQPIRARSGAIVFYSVVGNVWFLPVISLLLKLTLYRGYGLSYQDDWRGFVRTKKTTIVGLYSITIP